MSSRPHIKRGLLDPLISSVSKRPQLHATTPEPASGPSNSNASHEALQIQPTTMNPCNMLATPLPATVDSTIRALNPPPHDELASTGEHRATATDQSPTGGPLLKRVGTALKAFCHGAGAFPPLQATIDDVISCFETLKIEPEYQREYNALLLELELLSETLVHHLQSSSSAHMSIVKQTNVIKKRRDQPQERKLAKDAQDENEVLSAYHGIKRAFRQLQTNAGLSVWSIVEKQAADSLLEKLTPSRLAAHNSTLATDVNCQSCTKHTRTWILLDLDQWSADPQTPNIYWMSGMAGTGKTTIAYMFAKLLKARGLLGASFFCTWALRRYSMSFQLAAVKALESDPDIGTRAITEQCKRLIKEPLSQVKDDIPDGLVVVIDALDKCSSANGVRKILDVLFKIAPDFPLKFFVTSRPEPDIRHRIEAQPNRARLICTLHDIKALLVQADIKLYLRTSLRTPLSPNPI
ncbi:Vegetative incompatibility protein het-e-1 [Rhizoctonia solani]|uniref:Vegetative incompatibility protein het-e-1 n=1 Tax=Rhizoctonia solani TaxID=456999 RepID=A0A8H7LZA6_9AGAM|nr:Vegetative incompatibility protein het-e-1 [Rhizoctonia solani]